jgi:hypothetical protein
MKNKKKVFRIKTNPVARTINKFNKPATHVDRKKRDRNGYRKHKGVEE